MGAARIAIAALLALGVVAVGTYVAGEQTEVVRLRTFDADGTAHQTKMWVVDSGGVPWVRVANPRRLWYQRLRREPRAALLRGGAVTAVIAHPEEAADVRARIDQLYRGKYGVVDWWYGLLLRRGAIPIRLEPVAPSP
jgi:hypothetical protein